MLNDKAQGEMTIVSSIFKLRGSPAKKRGLASISLPTKEQQSPLLTPPLTPIIQSHEVGDPIACKERLLSYGGGNGMLLTESNMTMGSTTTKTDGGTSRKRKAERIVNETVKRMLTSFKKLNPFGHHHHQSSSKANLTKETPVVVEQPTTTVLLQPEQVQLMIQEREAALDEEFERQLKRMEQLEACKVSTTIGGSAKVQDLMQQLAQLYPIQPPPIVHQTVVAKGCPVLPFRRDSLIPPSSNVNAVHQAQVSQAEDFTLNQVYLDHYKLSNSSILQLQQVEPTIEAVVNTEEAPQFDQTNEQEIFEIEATEPLFEEQREQKVEEPTSLTRTMSSLLMLDALFQPPPEEAEIELYDPTITINEQQQEQFVIPTRRNTAPPSIKGEKVARLVDFFERPTTRAKSLNNIF